LGLAVSAISILRKHEIKLAGPAMHAGLAQICTPDK
jgi:hypothetical protein